MMFVSLVAQPVILYVLPQIFPQNSCVVRKFICIICLEIFKLSQLVGGFNPSQKYQSKWESSPNRGENKKKYCFNHHLVNQNLPCFSYDSGHVRSKQSEQIVQRKTPNEDVHFSVAQRQYHSAISGTTIYIAYSLNKNRTPKVPA